MERKAELLRIAFRFTKLDAIILIAQFAVLGLILWLEDMKILQDVNLFMVVQGLSVLSMFGSNMLM